MKIVCYICKKEFETIVGKDEDPNKILCYSCWVTHVLNPGQKLKSKGGS